MKGVRCRRGPVGAPLDVDVRPVLRRRSGPFDAPDRLAPEGMPCPLTGASGCFSGLPMHSRPAGEGSAAAAAVVGPGRLAPGGQDKALARESCGGIEGQCSSAASTTASLMSTALLAVSSVSGPSLASWRKCARASARAGSVSSTS